jgi:hypothetical protein
MRTLAKFFGYAGGIVVVIVAGQYAYMTSDSPVSGAIWAFLYGFIAVGGLFGPALASRVWRHNKAAAAFIWAVAVASLTIAISNEVGAMAGRGSEQTAQHNSVASTVNDTRRSLALAETERAGLKFTPANDAAVKAAQAKADAAALAKTAECTVRGPKCREKETAESQALADLAAITGNKALTDQAAKLDAQIAELRDKIEKAGPVRETNAQGKALSRLFGLDETEAAKLATRQNTAMMIVVELLIVALILAAEEIEKNEQPKPAPAKLRPMARREEQEEAAPDAVAAELAPRPLERHSRPRLVASQPAPIGSVDEIMADLLETGRGKIEFAEAYAAYASACEGGGKRPVPANEFAGALAELCKDVGIAIEDAGESLYLLKVRIKGAEKKGARQ